MSLIVNLPGDTCNEILLHWLHFRDICKIDTAIANQNIRKQYLTFLQTLTGLSFSFLSCNAVYEWFYCRNIKVVSLEVNSLCFRNTKLAFRVRYETVREIKVSYFGNALCDKKQMVEVINACVFLQSLDCNYSLLTHVNVDLLSHLKFLSVLLNRSKQIVTEIEHIKSHCKRLDSLRFYSGCCECEAFLDILRLNPALKTLSVTYAKLDVMDCLVQHCRYLEDINLETSCVSLSMISTFLRQRPAIQRFFVKNADNRLLFEKRDDQKKVMLSSFKEEEVSEFLLQIHNIADLEMIGNKYDFESVLLGLKCLSKDTLTALRVGLCGIMDVKVLADLSLHFPLLSHLEIAIDGSKEIVELFRLELGKRLTFLKIFGSPEHLDLTLILHICEVCPLLQSYKVQCVREEAEMINHFKEYVYHRYYLVPKALIEVNFPETIEGYSRRLRYVGGRFTSVGMEKYLTSEERLQRKPNLNYTTNG